MTFYGARSNLARIVLEKAQNDEYLSTIDRNEWYKIADIEQLKLISHKFLQFDEDQETKNFLDKCYEKSEWFFTQFFHSIMMSILKWFMSITSINGLLQRGSMFVFSVNQFRLLIDYDVNFAGQKLNNLLDLGAGDGEVTAKMAPFFKNVYATEMSFTMKYRLQQKGYKVVDVDSWDKIKKSTQVNKNIYVSNEENTAFQSDDTEKYLKFDVVSCLNLLDRCDQPITLLKKIKQSLVKNGLLVVALVLPFRPYVEYNKDNKPSENLFDKIILKNADSNSSAFCQTSEPQLDSLNQECPTLNKVNMQITQLVNDVFTPLGFELVKFSKVGYLCEGNLSQSFYYLIDYLFVFRSV